MEDAPLIMRATLRWGWSAIGFKLGSARAEGHVLGWELRRSASDYVLLGADSRIGLFEYTLQRVLLRHLGAHFKPQLEKAETSPPIQVADALSILLSMLAHAGAASPAEVASAFEAARAELSRERLRPMLLPREKCDVRALDGALGRLADTAPRLRGEILGAAVAAVATDGMVTIAEGELLRAIADALDCPMPPLLPGQRAFARLGDHRALG